MRREAALDIDTILLVLEKVGPWTRARCACINREWRRAASSVDVTKQNWVINVIDQGEEILLQMYNILIGQERVVKVNLPSNCFRGDEYIFKRASVLYSFSGLLLIRVDACAIGTGTGISKTSLVLGDPFLSKWINLPSIDRKYLDVAGFCSSTSTLIVSDRTGRFTATFSLKTAEWKLPSNKVVLFKTSRVCCVGKVFYSVFRTSLNTSSIACYDPVNNRKWQRVQTFPGNCHYQGFLVAPGHDRLLLYAVMDQHKGYQLFDVVLSGSSATITLIMDDKLPAILGRFLCPGRALLRGEDGITLWVSGIGNGIGGSIMVLSTKDNMVKQSKCFVLPFSSFVVVAAPGTAELLDDLDRKRDRN